MSDLTSKTLTDLSQGLAHGDYKATEVTQAFLDQIDTTNGQNNAFLHVAHEQAMQQAKDADALRQSGNATATTGLPIAIKDMILTEGMPTTAASKILENFTAPYDATVIRRLKDAGFVLLGKTNCDEFAMGSSNENSHFGPVRNPFDPTRVPGGSSGGSAACIHADQSPASLGTDTGGSIRQPAAFCGCVGLKPTYGRVSRFGSIAFASSLDQIGPFAKTVNDTEVVYRCIAGFDPSDATTHAQDVSGTAKPMDLKGLRVGIIKEYDHPSVHDVIRDGFAKTLKTVKSEGAELVDVSVPLVDHALSCYYVIAPAEASSNLSRFDGVRYTRRSENIQNVRDIFAQSRSEGFGPEVQRRILLGTFVLSSGYYDAYYLKARKVRRTLAAQFAKAFESVDVILTPSTPTTAFEIGAKTQDPAEMYLSDLFTVGVSLAGLPGLALPTRLSEKGLPMGIQVVAPHFQEETLFAFGKTFEKLMNANLRPGMKA